MKLKNYIPEIKIIPSNHEGKSILEQILRDDWISILVFDSLEEYIGHIDDDDVYSTEEKQLAKLYFEKVYPYINIDFTDRYSGQFNMSKKYKDMLFFENPDGDGFNFIFHNYGQLNYD